MKVKKAFKLLKKIGSLLQHLEGNKTSSLERDLLLSYTRDLYEVFLSATPADNNGQSESPNLEISKRQQIDDDPETAEGEEVVEREVSIPDDPPEVKEPPVTRAGTELDSGDTENVIAETVPPKAEIRTEPAEEGEEDLLEELFAIKASTELSDKLSSTPISDIKKALGINEKILIINDLFGGRKDVFEQTLTDLESFFSYDQARAYLRTGPARKYNWTAGQKKKVASNFIKIVRRRYSN